MALFKLTVKVAVPPSVTLTSSMVTLVASSSITVAIHEIPQEIGDYAVLLHSGIKKRRAIFLNFISATSAVIGGVFGFFMFSKFSSIIPYGVLITAGGFLYIALSDIVPSMHKHKKKSVLLVESIILIGSQFFFYYILTSLH